MTHDIKTGNLSNGIQYVLVNNPNAYGAMVQTTIRAGSRHEKPQQNGLAHFLEHMAFKGTTTRSSKDLSVWIEDLGGDINAMTGPETTTFFASLYGKNVDEGISFISDILNNPVFDADAINSERMVINQEIAMYKDDGMSCAMNLASSIACPDHPLGRPILGTEETLTGFTRKDFLDFTNKHYVTGNMIIGVAGNLTGDIIGQLESEYGHKSITKRSAFDSAIFEEGSGSEQDDSAQSSVVMMFDSPYGDNEEQRATRLAITILGRGMSSMLFQNIREEMGLCYGIGATMDISEDHATSMIYSSTTPDNLDDLMLGIAKTLREASGAISDDMVAKAKIKLLAPYVISYDSHIGTMRQTVHELSTLGEIIGPDRMVEKYGGINTSQVKRAMINIIESKMVFATHGPTECKYDHAGLKDIING